MFIQQKKLVQFILVDILHILWLLVDCKIFAETDRFFSLYFIMALKFEERYFVYKKFILHEYKLLFSHVVQLSILLKFFGILFFFGTPCIWNKKMIFNPLNYDTKDMMFFKYLFFPEQSDFTYKCVFQASSSSIFLFLAQGYLFPFTAIKSNFFMNCGKKLHLRKFEKV